MADENIICPDCETENKPDAKRCSNCGYAIAAQKDFERMATVTARNRKKKAEAENKPVEKDGFFDVLT